MVLHCAAQTSYLFWLQSLPKKHFYCLATSKMQWKCSTHKAFENKYEKANKCENFEGSTSK